MVAFRVMTALFSGAALMNAAMAVASAVSTIVAGDRLGARWGAVPNTAGIVGTGIGALALTALMARRGRRFGLTCGYMASACGAAVAAAGVATGEVTALTAGMLLLGLGNAGAQLSRYAAADLYPPERRGSAIGTVVWAGAIGAMAGPLLLKPSNDAATAVNWTPLTGPYVLAMLATLGAAAAVTAIRPNRKSHGTDDPMLDVGGHGAGDGSPAAGSGGGTSADAAVGRGPGGTGALGEGRRLWDRGDAAGGASPGGGGMAVGAGLDGGDVLGRPWDDRDVADGTLAGAVDLRVAGAGGGEVTAGSGAGAASEAGSANAADQGAADLRDGTWADGSGHGADGSGHGVGAIGRGADGDSGGAAAVPMGTDGAPVGATVSDGAGDTGGIGTDRAVTNRAATDPVGPGAAKPGPAGRGPLRPGLAEPDLAGASLDGTGQDGTPGLAKPDPAGRGGVGVAGGGGMRGRMRLREVVRTSGARTAFGVMATAQVVMVAVMTAAPLDMHMHGQGLDAVGMALSAHTFGMFAFSPLTGRLLDRLGARPVMLAGLFTLTVAAILAATTPEDDVPFRTGALFLLGYGWNLCFVGGSGRLARDLPASARASIEGAVDAAVWSIAAAASLASTLVLSAGGYAALGWIAAALAVLPAALLFQAE